MVSGREPQARGRGIGRRWGRRRPRRGPQYGRLRRGRIRVGPRIVADGRGGILQDREDRSARAALREDHEDRAGGAAGEDSTDVAAPAVPAGRTPRFGNRPAGASQYQDL